MAGSVNRRGYDSPRRREQARATRQALLDAARELFVERGYASTTIAAIAARARVSAETVYATFGSKRALLERLVDVAIAGSDEAAPVLQQDWVRELRDEGDARRRVAILARHGHAILRRRAAVDEVVRAAADADAEIAVLHERGRRERLAGQRELLRIAVGQAPLPAGLDLRGAADVLYAIGSPEVYRLLVDDRGWSDDRFGRWYADTLVRLLLGD